MVYYDHREAASPVPGYLELEGLTTQAAQLPVGDYVVSERIGIERKTETDLAASIRDGRLFDQLGRLREAYSVAVLLVERSEDSGGVSANARAGALAWALRQGVSVLPVTGPQASAEWIARLYHQERKPASGPRGSGPKPSSPDRRSEEVVAQLPGISLVLARRLLEHFGSVRAVFAAEAEALQVVEGIGPSRAEGISALLHHRYQAGDDDLPF